jgi:hypothetical protein
VTPHQTAKATRLDAHVHPPARAEEVIGDMFAEWKAVDSSSSGASDGAIAFMVPRDPAEASE